MTNLSSAYRQSERAARTTIRSGSYLDFTLLAHAAFAAPHAQSIIEVSNERRRLFTG
jgi:hypothetical protein